MADRVVLLSIPGLRGEDLSRMPRLTDLARAGDRAPLAASFPAVTCPVQVNMTTGAPPSEHGVVGNGFFWRDRIGEKLHGVEMWTAWNEVVQRPQVWDRLHEHDSELTSAVWFPMLAKGCGADFVCTPAPIHNPDGSESLWCYTKPEAMYGELRDELGHFPLQNFWGPMSQIASTAWIASSLVWCVRRERPRFVYAYLPHLDYAAQKFGPDSAEAHRACGELDGEIGKLVDGLTAAYTGDRVLWLVASEYAITPVDHVVYPNRVLREAGLLTVKLDDDGREVIDFAGSAAWAMADHQLSHVFVKDRVDAIASRVVDLFTSHEGVDEALAADGQARYEINHERSGDVVLVSSPRSWQAYYWWNDDALAPKFARTVDIHRKPGYDPVEMHFDPQAHAAGLGPTPLDATLVRGSHGAPARQESQRGVMLSSERGVFVEQTLADVDVCEMVLRQFGV
ncbi:MAG: nucleotide pyrophosphatase/phosphodiesterase family protein [Planctomycetota bacterium]